MNKKYINIRLKILNRMIELFPELFSKEIINDILGFNVFSDKTFSEEEMTKINKLSQIHIMMVRIFQNKESISNIYLSKFEETNKTWLEVIKSKDIDKVSNWLETEIYHR